jgi:hypothetical protein
MKLLTVQLPPVSCYFIPLRSKFRATKSRRMRWAEHIPCTEKMRNFSQKTYRINLEDLSVDGRVIIKLILTKQGVRVWTGFIWFREGSIGGLL